MRYPPYDTQDLSPDCVSCYPDVNCGATVKAVVSNQRPVDLLIARQIGIPDDVRTLCAETGEGVEVCDLGDGKWQARLEKHYAVDVPSAKQCVGNALQIEPTSLSEWQFIGDACDKDIRNITGRDVLLERAVETVSDREIGHRTCHD